MLKNKLLKEKLLKLKGFYKDRVGAEKEQIEGFEPFDPKRMEKLKKELPVEISLYLEK